MKSIIRYCNSALLLSLIVVSVFSCGEEDPASMFTVTTIGYTTTDHDPRIVYVYDSNRKDSRVTIVETEGEATDLKTRVRHYKFTFLDYKDNILYEFSEPFYMDDLNLNFAEVITSVESKRFDGEHYLLAKVSSEGLYFIDTKKETKFNFGKHYNYGVFWVNDTSNNFSIGHAILFSGGVTYWGDGIVSIKDISSVDFFNYNSSKTEEWEKIEGAFDNIPEKEMVFEGARNIILKEKNVTGATNYGTIVVLIDSDGKMRYLETRDLSASSMSDLQLNDKTPEYTAPIRNVQELKKLKMFSFDYDYRGHITKSDDSIGFSAYMCAVIESETDPSKYDLHVFRPMPTGSHTVIEDVYPGQCSVTYYSRTTSAITFSLTPWVTYRSAKNELSVGIYDKNEFEFDTFVLDKADSDNWNFAGKISSISKSENIDEKIIIFYNDDRSIKIAVCNDKKKCGNDSSL